jgi:hypothetical protein
MHEGLPATRGTGPEEYTARVAFEMSAFDQLKDGLSSFELGGFPARLDRRDHFYVLRVTGFASSDVAERFSRVIRGAMTELSARKGATFLVQPILPIDRNEVPTNVQIRDGLAAQHYPAWNRRPDGSITDGGIWPHQSCILPEHERIWEYPLLWGKPLREITVDLFQSAVTSAHSRPNLATALEDQRLQAAAKFLNLANGEPNREVGFVLYATVLETLADEDGQAGVGKVVARCRVANGGTYDEEEGRELYRIRSKLVHEGVLQLSGSALSWDQFSGRYWRARALAGQGVILRLDVLSH